MSDALGRRGPDSMMRIAAIGHPVPNPQMGAELDEQRSLYGCMTGPIKMILPTCSHGARR